MFTISQRLFPPEPYFDATVANMLHCPPQQCHGKMLFTQQISSYGNSRGPHCEENMAAKGELQQPSCIYLWLHTSDKPNISVHSSVTIMSLEKPCFVYEKLLSAYEKQPVICLLVYISCIIDTYETCKTYPETTW